MASAARSSVARSSFAVSRALDITVDNECPLAKLGEKGTQASSPASQGSTMANWPFLFAMHDVTHAETGGAREGRSLFLLVPTEGWWCPTEDWVKFGQVQCAELLGSGCIHQTSPSCKCSPCLG